MDITGTNNTVTLPASPARGRQAPVLPRPVSGERQVEVRPAAEFDARAAEQQRLETVRRAARDVANVFVVSDRRFTIFKDSSGQYITRFTSLRDGQVTYIPEPELLKLSGGSVTQALSIKV